MQTSFRVIIIQNNSIKQLTVERMFMLYSVILNEHDSLLRNRRYANEHKNDIDETV